MGPRVGAAPSAEVVGDAAGAASGRTPPLAVECWVTRSGYADAATGIVATSSGMFLVEIRLRNTHTDQAW